MGLLLLIIYLLGVAVTYNLFLMKTEMNEDDVFELVFGSLAWPMFFAYAFFKATIITPVGWLMNKFL